MTIYSTGLAVCGSWQLESLRSKLSEVGLIERELMSATVESQVRRLSTTSLVLISQSRPQLSHAKTDECITRLLWLGMD